MPTLPIDATRIHPNYVYFQPIHLISVSQLFDLIFYPIHYTKMPQRSKSLVEQEGRILLAIQAIRNNRDNQKPISVKKAAELYGIPRTALRDWINGAILKSI
jgi:hypothetical protein